MHEVQQLNEPSNGAFAQPPLSCCTSSTSSTFWRRTLLDAAARPARRCSTLLSAARPARREARRAAQAAAQAAVHVCRSGQADEELCHVTERLAALDGGRPSPRCAGTAAAVMNSQAAQELATTRRAAAADACSMPGVGAVAALPLTLPLTSPPPLGKLLLAGVFSRAQLPERRLRGAPAACLQARFVSFRFVSFRFVSFRCSRLVLREPSPPRAAQPPL